MPQESEPSRAAPGRSHLLREPGYLREGVDAGREREARDRFERRWVRLNGRP